MSPLFFFNGTKLIKFFLKIENEILNARLLLNKICLVLKQETFFFFNWDRDFVYFSQH